MPNSSKYRLLTGTVLSLVLVMGLGACSARNIHKTLSDDTRIMYRDWTIMTRDPTEAAAGDHGTEYSNPVLFENTLIFGNHTKGLVSLYPGMNQIRWRLPVLNGIGSEITVDKGNAYFGGRDGYLYSVRLENGHVNWRYQIRNPLISRPVIKGGRLFVTTSDDIVYAFDAGSGQWLWHYRRRTATAATMHGASTPLVDGNEVLAGLSDGFLVSLNLQDGNLKWEKKLHRGSKFTDVDASPVLYSGTLYVPSYDGSLYAMARRKGKTLWRFDSGGSKDVVVETNRVFLPSSDGFVYCLQRNSGKVLWKFELDGGVPTKLAVTDRYLVFGSTHQYLYVIDKNNGQGVYRFDAGLGAGFSGAPLYDPKLGRVYILSGAGNLYAFTFRKNVANRPLGQTDPFVFSDF